MAAKRRPEAPKPAPKPNLGLDNFTKIDAGQGLSLDDLGSAFAQLMEDSGSGAATTTADAALPYANPAPAEAGEATELPAGEGDGQPFRLVLDDLLPREADDEACPLCPRTIVEALLFVGHAENRPLASAEMAALMRGVREGEIPQLVAELNETYAEQGSPYSVVSAGAGFRLELLPEFRPLADRFAGRMREARLSQPAVDVLAIVAYHQPIARAKIDALRGRPSQAILNQLVRRQLLAITPVEGNSKLVAYSTTPRFLDLFELASLSELPRSQEGEEWLQ